ncbi:MAG: polyphenol oxidase family protein [Ruminococcus sp.]|nr:polyphenol oxidase family protein [Ruminococcus sp.]
MKRKKIYEIIEMPNGLKMMKILPICETGVAEAYASIRSANGFSKGPCGTFNPILYKLYGLENGIKDFKLGCEAVGVSELTVITNRLNNITDLVRCVSTSDLEGYDIFDEESAPRADGLVTDDNNICLFNYAADCAIAFIVDPKKKVCGSCHASWKGSLLGIFEREIDAFVDEYGSNKNDIICVVCPSIGIENFEVDDDVAQQFVAAGFAEFVDFKTYEKPHIDLPAVNRQILVNYGLLENNVFVIDDMDTVRDEKYWHSFRRGPIVNGKHLNGQNGYWIKLR